MDAIPLFLNEGSYPSNLDGQFAEAEVVEFLKTIREIKALGRPFVIGADAALSDLILTNDFKTLASLSVVDREWWRFIRGIDQRSPFSRVPQTVPPEDGMHALLDDDYLFAPLWAIKNNAFMLSFPTRLGIRKESVAVGVCRCEDSVHESVSVECRNMSMLNHVDFWRDALLDFNYIESASSTVFQNDDFLLKMYLHDHDPPHIHVYQSGNLGRCVGRVRFDYVEVMEDEGFSGSVRKSVLSLLHERQEALLRAWDRCRSGNLPNRI